MEIIITKQEIEELPSQLSGLYYFYVGNEIIYIGQSIDIKKRLIHHFSKEFSQHPLINYELVEFIIIRNKYGEEEQEINKYQPTGNIQFNPNSINNLNVCDGCIMKQRAMEIAIDNFREKMEGVK